VASQVAFKSEVVVALMSYASDRPHDTIVKAGARLRADSPIVRANPLFYAEDGLSTGEMAQLIQQRFPAHEPQQHIPLASPPKLVQDEECVICVQRIGGGGGLTERGDTLAIEVGTRVARNDPRIQKHLDHFVPVVSPGLTRENSVRAVTDNYEYRRDANGDFIIEEDTVKRMTHGNFRRFRVWARGQWVSRDNPMVKKRPSAFEFIC
jgi:hypothetical protein